MYRFLAGEIEQRRGGLQAYDEEMLAFLNVLNTHLEPFEKTLYRNLPETVPTVFIISLPRSGTTLLAQLLVRCLEVGYINDLAAKFWRAPVCGVRLSKSVLGSRRSSSFRSEYGKSADIAHPHEFSYFWHYWLKMQDMPPYIPREAALRIDWKGLRKTFLNIGAEFGKAMVYKAYDVGFHIERFSRLLEQAIFLTIERDPLEVARSIARARIDYYSNLETWWSIYPVEYEELTRRPWWEQIAGQIFHLSRMYESQLRMIPGGRVVRTTYRELCSHPQGILDSMTEATLSLSGYRFEQISPPPESFERSTKKMSVDIEEKLKQGLETFNLLGSSGDETCNS